MRPCLLSLNFMHFVHTKSINPDHELARSVIKMFISTYNLHFCPFFPFECDFPFSCFILEPFRGVFEGVSFFVCDSMYVYVFDLYNSIRLTLTTYEQVYQVAFVEQTDILALPYVFKIVLVVYVMRIFSIDRPRLTDWFIFPLC